MFGKKKNKNKFGLFTDKKDTLEANASHIEKREKQILEDISQVEENTLQLAESALRNVGTEIGLLETIDALLEEQSKAYSEYVALRENVKEQVEAGMGLVEQNKHFTTPSKYLSEAPQTLRERNRAYEICLNEMTESNFEERVAALREEITESYKDIQELERTIHNLVSLLKESNMAATKLLMKFQTNEKIMRTSVMRDYSEDFGDMKARMVELRNADEEISKFGERSGLQMGDIKEEMQAIKRELAELESDISYIMDTMDTIES